MPCGQQIKKSMLCLILALVVIFQTALQLSFTYKYNENGIINDPYNDFSSSEANRLKRSASLANSIKDINSMNLIENDLSSYQSILPKPTVSSLAQFLTLTKSQPSQPLEPMTILSTISPTPSRDQHVQDWSEIPKYLFLNNYYKRNFSLINSDLCQKKPNLLILITSAIDHFILRNNVRQTWGHYGLRSDVQFAFVIGDSLLHNYNESVQQEFEKEINLYNDLIIAGFEDTYRNLTLKTLHMLDWVSTYCTEVPYFVKTDDDVFLNVPEFLSLIREIKDEDSLQPKIYGHIFSGHFPSRNTTHKHFVPYDVYPYELTYPNFTSGPAYLMSTKIVRPLFEEALKLPFIPLEDVLITGFSAMNLGIPRVDIPEFLNEMNNPSNLSACQLINILAGMTDGSSSQMNYVWFNYMMGRNLCIWKNKRRAKFLI